MLLCAQNQTASWSSELALVGCRVGHSFLFTASCWPQDQKVASQLWWVWWWWWWKWFFYCYFLFVQLGTWFTIFWNMQSKLAELKKLRSKAGCIRCLLEILCLWVLRLYSIKSHFSFMSYGEHILVNIWPRNCDILALCSVPFTWVIFACLFQWIRW